MLVAHGGDRMTIKPDDNTVDENTKTKDFSRYEDAAREYQEQIHKSFLYPRKPTRLDALAEKIARAKREGLVDTAHQLVCIPCFFEGKRTRYPRTAKICHECARTNDRRPQKARGEV